MKGRLLAPVLVAGLLAACAGAEGAECEFDAECVEPLICFADVCQAIGDPGGEIRLEVVPPTATGLAPTTFPMAAQPLRLDLCGPSQVEGEVEGTAEVIAEGTPPGLPSRRMELRRRVAGRFTLPLAPGSWDLRFVPEAVDALDLPPPWWLHVEVPPCETVSLGRIEGPGEVHRVRFVPVIDPETDPRPRCGLVARVHDRRSGAAVSRTLTIPSASGDPCAAPAEGFILPFLRPETTGVGAALELRVGPLDGGRPTVAWTTTPFLAGATPLVDLGAVGVGASIPERVRVVVQDPTGAPVAGARVRLQGRLEDGLGRFEPPLAAPIGTGIYEIWLLPGRYEALVEPPPGLRAATARCLEPLEGGSCETRIEVEAGLPSSWRSPLPLPLRLHGRAVDAERVPLAGARIVASPIDGGRMAQAIADGAGRYELFVDPGAYELIAQPQLRGAAWRRTGPVVVDMDTRFDLMLPQAALVVGTVLARDDGSAVHDTLVRAWRVDDEARGPHLVGETLTDANGRFWLPLPAGN